MNDKRQKIIEIIERNTNTIFPVQAPEEIADEIIELFKEGKFIPPTSDEAFEYIVEKSLMDNHTIPDIKKTAEMFVNYYETVDWKVGKAKKPMKTWKKALSNWCKRDWNKRTLAKVDESIQAHLLIQKQIKNG